MPPKTLIELYKIEPLDGTNYKRWSQKLFLCFEQNLRLITFSPLIFLTTA